MSENGFKVGEKIDYDAYIDSYEWRRMREKVLKRDQHKCAICGKKHKLLNVHHLTYDRLGDEDLDDLITLCPACHSEVHEYIDYFKDSSQNVDSQWAKDLVWNYLPHMRHASEMLPPIIVASIRQIPLRHEKFGNMPLMRIADFRYVEDATMLLTDNDKTIYLICNDPTELVNGIVYLKIKGYDADRIFKNWKSTEEIMSLNYPLALWYCTDGFPIDCKSCGLSTEFETRYEDKEDIPQYFVSKSDKDLLIITNGKRLH